MVQQWPRGPQKVLLKFFIQEIKHLDGQQWEHTAELAGLLQGKRKGRASQSKCRYPCTPEESFAASHLCAAYVARLGDKNSYLHVNAKGQCLMSMMFFVHWSAASAFVQCSLSWSVADLHACA